MQNSSCAKPFLFKEGMVAAHSCLQRVSALGADAPESGLHHQVWHCG